MRRDRGRFTWFTNHRCEYLRGDIGRFTCFARRRILRKSLNKRVFIKLFSQPIPLWIGQHIFNGILKGLCTQVKETGNDLLVNGGAEQAHEHIYKNKTDGYLENVGTEHMHLRSLCG